MKKKGISPVIATVLLIAMVVVIGLIIFLWFNGMSQEAITKFGGTNIELVCGDVAFEASYSSGTLFITNSGNVPIYGMKLKIFEDRSYDTVDLNGFNGLNQGEAYSDSLEVGGSDRIILTPVLLGTSEKGEKTFVCTESQYGYEIFV